MINEELRRIRKRIAAEETNAKTRKAEVIKEGLPPTHEGMVFLFTGYMISNPRKKEDQFPPEKESKIKEASDAKEKVVLQQEHIKNMMPADHSAGIITLSTFSFG